MSRSHGLVKAQSPIFWRHGRKFLRQTHSERSTYWIFSSLARYDGAHSIPSCALAGSSRVRTFGVSRRRESQAKPYIA